MKKFLKFFSAIFLVAVFTMANTEAYSQNKIFTKFAGAKTTLTNADTTYFTVSSIGAHDAASFQLNVEKTGGTLAGKAWLEVSNNNVDWGQISAADTLNIGNASAIKFWEVKGFNYRSARIRVITSNGTSKPTVAAYFIRPK